MDAFPTPEKYFARLDPDRPVFQGDVFSGIATAFWAHPETFRAELAGEARPDPEVLTFPSEQDLRQAARLSGPFAMLIPHPCDIAEGEKGDTHPFRLMAPVEPIQRRHGYLGVKQVKRGQVAHALWVPRWEGGPRDADWLVDLRRMTCVDQAYLSRRRRVAALSPAAWYAVVNGIVKYFSGVAMERDVFLSEHSDLHPDL